ncbi:sigma-70 family RNA polymerase sigma factor [Paroceanicella profunda]|uniref:Sigma-70 family RNA polymerase sigma factor n=1 Tax=Paroceanicella profunda TaxID=2579971 RepID=A0A5B8FTL1_9RHOB|nr:sigma-70 family RNA polymerase sigma factor [Paroceanicella profunda]QDL90400.1 sigma-70 family RNA polymerase sigma factor [Paroceanicella profunda]
MLGPDPDVTRASDISHDVVALIPQLRGYARALTGGWDDADDLVQDTLAKAIAHAEKFTRDTNLRAWLFTIMRNTFLNEIKLRRRERPGREACVSLSSRAVSAPTQEWSVRGGELMRAIDRVPEPYREMLMLVVVMGESYEDSARICNCAIGTVKSRVSRARTLVMEELHESAI